MIHGPIDDEKKSNDFCCFRCVVEQWALTVIKFVSFFCINICCFSTKFYISFVPQWRSHPSFMKIVDVFLICTPHKTGTLTVRLAVTTKYQGNGFAAEVLLGRDHPRVVPIGPIIRGVIAFRIFSNNDRPPI